MKYVPTFHQTITSVLLAIANGLLFAAVGLFKDISFPELFPMLCVMTALGTYTTSLLLEHFLNELWQFFPLPHAWYYRLCCLNMVVCGIVIFYMGIEVL